MKFKYILPKPLIERVSNLDEFASGGMQVSIKIKNGSVFEKLLISNCMYIVAMRGYMELPFCIEDILEIFKLKKIEIQKKEVDGFIGIIGSKK